MAGKPQTLVWLEGKTEVISVGCAVNNVFDVPLGQTQDISRGAAIYSNHE